MERSSRDCRCMRNWPHTGQMGRICRIFCACPPLKEPPERVAPPPPLGCPYHQNPPPPSPTPPKTRKLARTRITSNPPTSLESAYPHPPSTLLREPGYAQITVKSSDLPDDHDSWRRPGQADRQGTLATTLNNNNPLRIPADLRQQNRLATGLQIGCASARTCSRIRAAIRGSSRCRPARRAPHGGPRTNRRDRRASSPEPCRRGCRGRNPPRPRLAPRTRRRAGSSLAGCASGDGCRDDCFSRASEGFMAA